MTLYAPSPALRGRQLAADAGLVAWVALWVVVARTAHRSVLALAEPARAVEELGASVAAGMSSAARAAEDVPVVGDELAAPFAALGSTAGSLGGAGLAAQEAVGTLATLLAVVLAALPVGWLLLRWLRWRLDWARDAGAARLLATADPGLLAVRALATAPLPRLAALGPGTADAWRAGDPAATRALAAVELARLGLPAPAAVAVVPGAGQRDAGRA